MTGVAQQITQDVEVICLGEALVDRLGPLGGDPAIDQPVEDCFGGAPANVACGLARLGTQVAFIGRLGNDPIGLGFRDLMNSRSINLSGLQIDNERPTRVVLVRRDLQGERSFQGFAGEEGKGFADEALDLSNISKNWSSLVGKATWLVIGTIPLASSCSSGSLLWVINQAHQDGLKVAIDINWRPTFWDAFSDPSSGPTRDSLEAISIVFEKASLLKLSKEEAEWFFHSSDPLAISRSLPQQPDVVITDGPRPIKWVLGDFSGQIASISPESVIDTTGAGDSFMAGLIHKIQCFSNDSLQQALDNLSFAAACGACVCTAPGAIDPQPSYSDVMALLESRNGDSS